MSIKIQGLDVFVKGLKKEIERSQNAYVDVFYTAAYALYVHEAVGMVLQGQPRPKPHKGLYWDPQGKAKAKFLEDPLKEKGNYLRDMIYKLFSKGVSLDQAVWLSGHELKKFSIEECPVDWGPLRASCDVTTPPVKE